jgi:hypothetical protein
MQLLLAILTVTSNYLLISFYEGYYRYVFFFLINTLINASFYNCYFM